MNLYRLRQEMPEHVDRRILADNEIDAMTYFMRTCDHPKSEYSCSLHVEGVEIAHFPERKRKGWNHKERLAAVNGG